MIHCSLKYFIIYYFNKRKHWDLSHGLYGHARPGTFFSWDILFLAFETLFFCCVVVIVLFCFFHFIHCIKIFKTPGFICTCPFQNGLPHSYSCPLHCSLYLSVRSQIKYYFFIVSLFLLDLDEVSLMYDYISL